MKQKDILPTLTIFPEETKRLDDLFGIFFEDLNHAADGGLYGELLQNGSFEFSNMDNPKYHSFTAWEKIQRGNSRVQVHVEQHTPLNYENPHYLVMEVLSRGKGGGGVKNLGYSGGIPLVKDKKYVFSCWSMRCSSDLTELEVRLEDEEGEECGKFTFVPQAGEWGYVEGIINCTKTVSSGSLAILARERIVVALDHISLFPQDTYLGRKNGLRRDIAEALEELKPRFMRFPGGCLVHCGSLNAKDRNSMYRWKNTIGPREKRPSKANKWGYNQSYGLGFFELFQFCEDIGAKPIPVLPAGYDPHEQRIVPLDELGPWIQDALDLIEFANGDTTTLWGSIRADLGHPEPFNLEYIAIGNEEVGEAFFERYALFHREIKAKYPHIKIINTAGPNAAGSEFERGWTSALENGSDYVDEHYYQSPEWFIANMHRYQDYDVNGPKVFLGEYASWGNTWRNALVEAAYMIGLEKAPVVGLACYAPLLCHVEYINWKPNLIWFDNWRVLRTPNYYVQKLFMNDQGDVELRSELAGVSIEDYSIPPIKGEVVFEPTLADVQYTDITIYNDDNGFIQRVEDVQLLRNGKPFVVGRTTGENFTIEFTATKIDGSLDKEVYGGRGFELSFGKQPNGDRLIWKIGGWQNQDATIETEVNHRNSCLTQSLFTVETGKSYRCRLIVKGRSIRAEIDDDFIQETEDKLPVIEPLYYAASRDENSDEWILKAVNLADTKMKVNIRLEGWMIDETEIKVTFMAGYPDDAENTWECPDAVKPKEKQMMIQGNNFDYEFPPRSLSILRLMPSEKHCNALGKKKF